MKTESYNFFDEIGDIVDLALQGNTSKEDIDGYLKKVYARHFITLKDRRSVSRKDVEASPNPKRVLGDAVGHMAVGLAKHAALRGVVSKVTDGLEHVTVDTQISIFLPEVVEHKKTLELVKD